MRTSRLLAAAVAALLSIASAGAAEALPKLAGQDYGKVRAALLQQNWQPVALPDADRCMAGDKRCAGRPEMYVCAGTGLGQCVFVWRRKAVTIDVVTEGEERPVVRFVRPRQD
jgi:ABC-type amino acid transport substrate-binding protein